jgi:chromosome segregation ATPase
MAPSELQRQVSQNKNDVIAVYDLLRHTNEKVESLETQVASITVVLKRHDHRFDELQQTLDLHGAHLNRLGDTIRGQGKRLDSLETRFDTLENRFDTLETRFDTLENRFDSMETRFDSLDTRLRKVETKVDTIGGQMTEVLTILRGSTGT